jgi:Zn-dependent M16 (insulinase) family peptidase
MDPQHPSFDLISGRDLPEYRGRGLLYRHKATGCEVYHLSCDEAENTFAFAFRTPSRDGSGAAHIVEHSVLCGSERYPVKDPFLVMARRSLATYLNALTYPDRTVYPASSALEADYFNLMSVYGDAVFFPRLDMETFRQEGHRLEFDGEGRLSRSGVVYNEMRGDYASADSLTSTASVTSLFEAGHPYSYDSGGNPDLITGLTYEAFVAFWADHYRPGNCRIFLHGDIDTTKQLDYLEVNFLSRGNPRWKSAGGAVADVPVTSLRGEARRVELPCPPEAGSDGTTSIVLNWLLPPQDGTGDLIAAELLAELLIGHDGAPLALALRNSGLGDDLSPQTGFDTNYRQPIFTVGLRGTERGREAAIEDLVQATLARFAKVGPGPDELDAAFHSIAFANREIKRGSGTYGTRLMSRAYRTWIRGASPEEGLCAALPLERLRARIAADPTFIGGLAERLLLANRHRTTVTAYPDEGLFGRKAAEAANAMRDLEAGLSPAAREAILAESKLLAALQEKADRPADLALLPRLRAGDIPREIDRVPRESSLLGGCPLSVHPLFTNGIVYLDLAFPLDGLSPEAMLWLPLLSRFISAAGLPGLPYDKVAAEMARHSGGFGTLLESGSPVLPDGSPAGRPSTYAIFRLKALSERFPKALDLVLGLLAGADTGDTKRVADILSELGNDVISALVPAGNSFAVARAGASLGGALAVDDLWRGMSQLRFLRELRERDDIAEVARNLDGLRASLVARRGLRLNLTTSPEDLPAARAALQSGLPRLPAEPGPAVSTPLSFEPPAASEAYAIPSQVGFAAAACRSSRIGQAEYAHETVLAHLLTTGLLWEELRVKRGAYGASCYLEGLEGAAFFSTYRDPRPADSLGYFAEALERLSREGAGDSDAIEEAVVGTAGRDLKPLLPEERGLADFRRELYGITDAFRLAKRRALLETGPSEVKAAAGRLAEAFKSASAVLISRSEDVQLLSLRRADTRAVDLSA